MSGASLMPRGCCPLCGAGLGVERIFYHAPTRSVIGNGHARQLTPQQARLFELLWPPRAEFRKAEELAGLLHKTFYRSPHGGVPCVGSLAKRLRKALTQLGIKVEGLRARDCGGYRLVIPRPTPAINKRAA